MILIFFMPVSSDGDVMKDFVKIFWWMFLILFDTTRRDHKFFGDDSAATTNQPQVAGKESSGPPYMSLG